MPEPPTTRLGLYKTASDGSELVDVQTDLLDNWDKLDLAPGFQVVTSSTRPSSPFSGKAIAESDTSYRTYFSNGTSPASASWVEIPNSSATYNSNLAMASGKQISIAGAGNITLGASGNITIGASGQINIGASGSQANFAALNPTASYDLLSGRVTGDTQSRIVIDTDGTINWGPGASAAVDTILYRSAANTLRTGDNLVVDLGLTVSGSAAITGTLTSQVETTTTGAVAATDFTVTSFNGRRTGGIATVVVSVTYGGATITGSSSGNITDTQCVTLPSGWRPANAMITNFDRSGVATGSVTIDTSGVCTLKTIDPTATIGSGNVCTFSATYVL